MVIYLRNFELALKAVWAYKLRSLFVILAVSLGIAALTIIISSIDGAQKKAREVVQWFGPDAAFVLGGDIKSRAVGQRVNTLTWADAKKIEQSLPGAYMLIPMRAIRDVQVKAHHENINVSVVVGSTANYAQTWNWPLALGRDLNDDDVHRARKVCILGDEPAQKLFPNTNPLGKTILINNLAVQVIGVLAYRDFSGGGPSINNRIVIPITTLTQRFNLDRKYFRALRVKFFHPELMDDHVKNLRALLRHEHNLGPGQADDFTILTAKEILKFLAMLKGSLVIFLGVTATVAIIVGGFVLANLFYLSVDERKNEIGLKLALGANKLAIRVQFLTEAIILTILGAICGFGLGTLTGQILSGLGLIPIEFSLKVFLISSLSALLIGLVFGLKPANQAANLNPIAALKGR
ncbi:ABC transporter permease [Desulfovulcanus sp.]